MTYRFQKPTDLTTLQDEQEPEQWEVLSCFSPVSNKGARDAAIHMLWGGFAMFMQTIDEFGPNPNLDQRKIILGYFNWLPYEYETRDEVKTALMWARSYFVKNYSVKFDSSNDTSLSVMRRGIFWIENYQYTWQEMVGYLRFLIREGCYCIVIY